MFSHRFTKVAAVNLASQPAFHTHTHAQTWSCLGFFVAAVLRVLRVFRVLLHHSFSAFYCIWVKPKVTGNFTCVCFSLGFAPSSSVCQNTYQKQHEVWLHRKRHTITFLWRSIYITQRLPASTGGGRLLSDGLQSSTSVQFYFSEEKSGNSHQECELF